MKKYLLLLAFLLVLTGCTSESVETTETIEASSEIAPPSEVEAFEENQTDEAQAQELQTEEEEATEALPEESIQGIDSKLYAYYEKQYLNQDYIYTLRTTVEGNGMITESTSTTAEKNGMVYLSKEDDLTNMSQIARDGQIYILNHEAKTMEIYPQEGELNLTVDAMKSIENLQIFEGRGTFFEKEYDTEWFEFMGNTITYYFEGEDLVGYEQRNAQSVSYTSLVEESHEVDDSLFEVPENYKLEVQTGEVG